MFAGWKIRRLLKIAKDIGLDKHVIKTFTAMTAVQPELFQIIAKFYALLA